MAVDFGTTNLDRFYTVPASVKFHLPNRNWTWLVIFKNDVNVRPNYVSIGGAYEDLNSYHLLCDSGNDGLILKVHTFSSVTANIVPELDRWMAFYGTRRDDNMYIGAGYIDDPGSIVEGTGLAVSSAFTPSGNLKIGLRSDQTSNATNSMQGSISDLIYIPGVAFTPEILKDVITSGVLPKQFWWNNRVFHGYLRHASSKYLVDLTGRHVLTQNGTGYTRGAGEIDPPRIERFKKNKLFSDFVFLEEEGGGGPAEIFATKLPLTGVGM